LSGRRPPRLRLPLAPLMPLAFLAEGWARVTGKEPFVTLDALRMARKKMYFSSDKARAELGYAPRPVRQGLADAVAWFRQAGYCT
jgi:dihydroflavonol-4-reductase